MDREFSSTHARPWGFVRTPRALAQRLVADLVPAERGRGESTVLLDPACGDGALLIAAIEVAQANGLGGTLELHGIELDAELAQQARDRVAAAATRLPAGTLTTRVRIECADALDPGHPWPRAHIVANPPWVSLSGRQAAQLPTELRERYRRDWSALGGWPSLHGAFLERIAQHVARGGAQTGSRARILLPAAVCDLDRYAATRRSVTAVARLPRPVEALEDSAFPGVVEPAVLVELASRRRAGAGEDATWRSAGLEEQRFAAALDHCPRLPPECFGDPGVHTGNSARDLVVRERDERWPGLREGRDLRAFELDPPRRGLRTDLERTAERRFRVAPLERYCAIPILIRQTADRPIAALHTDPTYFRNTLLACTPPPELDPAFCVAVLNSNVVARWHRARFADARQRAFPQVKVSHLRALPFPIVSRDEDLALHAAVCKAVVNGDYGAALERIDKAFCH